MKEFAAAKVNLYLHVTGRRADGYHLLDSLVVFADVGDVVEGSDDDALSLEVVGPFANALDPFAVQSAAGEGAADNLVLRAAGLLAAHTGTTTGARLRLTKNLPVAAGIGGGSADAAAALRLLARLWALDRSDLAGIALSLGADVPVCLTGRTARMGGVGETLTAAPVLPDCGLVLVNPGVPVATADVFRARAGGFSAPAALPGSWPDARTMAADLATLGNDLQEPAVALCPAIGGALAALEAAPDCLLARMSGSGATCFGLFPTRQDAARTAAVLAGPGRWCWGGGLRRDAT